MDNPKDAIGRRKVSMAAVPCQVLMEMGLAMQEGGIKHGRHNYRVVDVRASIYYDALWRHVTAWWEGQDIDPDSGLPHLAKAMASLAVIRDAEINGHCIDDRPPAMQDNWQADLNKKAGDLIDRLPEGKPAYTRITRPAFPEDFQMGEMTWETHSGGPDATKTPTSSLPGHFGDPEYPLTVVPAVRK